MMIKYGRYKRLFGVAVVLVLFAVYCTGCSEIAARYIMAPTNGGITEFPKTLPKNALFDSVFGVKVQENPPIGLIVWVIEPQTIQVWSGELDRIPLPPEWSDKYYSITLSTKDQSSSIHIRRVHPQNPEA